MKTLLLIVLSGLSLSAMADSSNLDGKWRSQCTSIGQNFFEIGEIEIYLTPGYMNFFESYYLDDKCSVPFSFEVASAFITMSDAPVGDKTLKYVDVTFNQFLEAPASPTMVDKFNEKKNCGFSDWKLGVYKDVTGLCHFPGTGTTIYNLNQFKDNKMMIGIFDSDHDGKTPERRPVIINENVVFERLRYQ